MRNKTTCSALVPLQVNRPRLGRSRHYPPGDAVLLPTDLCMYLPRARIDATEVAHRLYRAGRTEQAEQHIAPQIASCMLYVFGGRPKRTPIWQQMIYCGPRAKPGTSGGDDTAEKAWAPTEHQYTDTT